MTGVLVVLVVGLSFISHLSTVQSDPELERVTRLAFLDALIEAHITHKEAYMLLGYSKGHWSDMCAGQRSLPNVTRMAKLPWKFWSAYLPKIAYAICQKNCSEITEDIQQIRRAS